jgi:hypothetical protein
MRFEIFSRKQAAKFSLLLVFNEDFVGKKYLTLNKV